jgi:PGF-pre-PGF domain-containing protein
VRFNTTSLDKGDKVKIDGYLEDNTGNVDSFRLSFDTPDPNPDTDSGGDEGDSSGGGGLISPSSLDSEESGENKSSGKEKNGTVNDSTSSVEVSDSKNIEREKTVVERIETNKEAEISISETEESHKPPERTEKYSELNISKKTGEEIDMNLTFSVNQSWFNRENLRAESTALYRQNNSEWQKLPTKLLNETQETYIFESEVPGFSVFLIAAENQTGQNRRISENTGNNSQKNTTSMKTSWPGEESFQNLRQILLSILLISIPLIGYELSEIKERREIVEELEELKEKTSENRVKTKLIQAEISLREDGIEEARERLSEIKEQTGKNGQR